MDPSIRRKVIAGDGREFPDLIQRIPDIPKMAVVEVALCAPCPPTPSKSLVDVKLQGLRPISIINVEPQVVAKVSRLVSSTDWSPVQFVGICVFSGQREFGG